METRVDSRRATKRLDNVKRAGKDLRPVFKAMRPVLRMDVGDHFRRNQSPDGIWPARARSSYERLLQTRGMRRKRGKRRGRLTERGLKRFSNQLGRLKGSYKFKTFAHRMEMISRAPWAGVHQHGGTVGRGSRIPKREFMWASRQALQQYKNLTGKYLAAAFMSGGELP